jgi:hypothetical protein
MPDGAQETGLADPCLTGEQEELAPAAEDLVDPTVGELE